MLLLRHNKMKTKPSYQTISEQRQMIVLKTEGCSYGLCTVCGYDKHASRNISSGDLIEQFEAVYKKGIPQLELLVPGSFFDDAEVDSRFRQYIFSRLRGEAGLERVLVESRPEYLTSDKLESVRELAHEKEVYVAVGLESSNDDIRNRILRKGTSKDAIERSVKTLAEYGLGLQAYVLVKPPELSEREAIEDAVRTAEYAFELGKKYGLPVTVALEPVFIARDTDLEVLYHSGRYELVSLWSVVEIIQRTAHLGEVSVGLDTEGLAEHFPHGCPSCDSVLREAIIQFSQTQKLTELESLDCICRGKS